MKKKKQRMFLLAIFILLVNARLGSPGVSFDLDTKTRLANDEVFCHRYGGVYEKCEKCVLKAAMFLGF